METKEIKLDNLIQKIKEEGVQEAKKQSEDIISQAEEQARQILEDARIKRDSIIRVGRVDADNLKKNGQEALRQAARDVLLSLRERIIELFDSVVKNRVSQQLSPENLKDIIKKIIENFKKGESPDIEILLSRQDKKELEGVFWKAFADELKKGVTLKTSPHIEKGFRIGEKNKNFYYDFTDEAIAQTFKLYLNPKIRDLLKEKNGQ